MFSVQSSPLNSRFVSLLNCLAFRLDLQQVSDSQQRENRAPVPLDHISPPHSHPPRGLGISIALGTQATNLVSSLTPLFPLHPVSNVEASPVGSTSRTHLEPNHAPQLPTRIQVTIMPRMVTSNSPLPSSSTQFFLPIGNWGDPVNRTV